MAESIGTARLDVVVNTDGVTTGIEKAKRSTQEMAGAVEQSSKRQKAALEKSIATFGLSRQEVLKWQIAQRTSGTEAARLNALLDKQVAKLGAQTRAQGAVASGMNNIGAAAKRAAGAFAGLVVATVGVGATFANIRNAINFADKLNDMNQRLGASAEALSGWAYAAQQTGTDMDALGIGLKKLAKNMAEALDPKSSQAGLFKALGIELKDTEGNLKSLEEVLPEIADGFKGIQNETLKLALAQELLGKSGSDLIEFFNQGSGGLSDMRDRARELGVELGQGTLTAADQFNDKLGDLKTAVKGLSLQVAGALLPQLEALVDWAVEFVSDGQNAANVAEDIASAARDIADAIGAIRGVFGVLGDLQELLGASDRAAQGLLGSLGANNAISSFLKGAIPGAYEPIIGGDKPAPQRRTTPVPDLNVPFLQPLFPQFSAVPLRQAEAASGQSAAEKRLGKFFENGSDPKEKAAKKAGKSEAEKELERLEAAYKSLAAQQHERIALFGKEGEVAKVQYELEHGALSKLTDAQAKKLGIDKELLLANAAQIDALVAAEKVTEKGKQLSESMITPMEELNRLRAEAAELLDKGAISQETYNRAMDAYIDPLQALLADMELELEMIGKSNAERAVMIELRRLNIDAMSAEGQAALQTAKTFEEEAKAKQRSIDLMDEFRSGASNALADIVTGAKSAKEAFADFFDDMARRITQMIAEKWIEKAFGNFGTDGGGSGGGDWLGAIFGALFGGGSGGGEMWADGGYTGPGGVLQPAGVVHKGEVVWSQRDVARAGGVGVVEGMRQGWLGYASGGVVGGRAAANDDNPRRAVVNNNTTFVLPHVITPQSQSQVADRTQRIQSRSARRN